MTIKTNLMTGYTQSGYGNSEIIAKSKQSKIDDSFRILTEVKKQEKEEHKVAVNCYFIGALNCQF